MSEYEDPESRTIVGRGSLMSFGLAGAALALVATASVWWTDVKHSLKTLEQIVSRQDASFTTMRQEMAQLRGEIERGREGFVTLDYLRLYMELVAARNPEIHLPPLPGEFR